jgi:hypothetical protein
MKLSELIAAVGDEEVIFQMLDECTHDINAHTATAAITFGTNQVTARDMAIHHLTPKCGMVVWLPRDKLKAAIEARDAKGAQC